MSSAPAGWHPPVTERTGRATGMLAFRRSIPVPVPTWMANVFRLPRRKIAGIRAVPADPPPAPVDPARVEARVDVELTIPRSRLDGFAAALAGDEGPGTGPHSPARLTAAVAGAIDRAGGSGSPSVSRSPAGVYTAEYWRFRIEAADPIAREVLARAGKAGLAS